MSVPARSSSRPPTYWTDFRPRPIGGARQASRESFPRCTCAPTEFTVRQGRVWTSAGVSAGIDLALALTIEDLGDEVAKRTAREMVLYYRRPGAQSQFSALLEMHSPDHRFSVLLNTVRARLDRHWTVETLAEEVCMSPRHFSRASLTPRA